MLFRSLTEAIRGLNPSRFSRIVVVALDAHERDYGFSAPLINEISKEYNIDNILIEVILLQHETKSQPESLAEGIRLAGIHGPILIKDSDNYFSLPLLTNTNAVGVIDLNKSKPVIVGNKSYIRPGLNGEIVGVVEKQVISNLFCCGAYFFSEADEFCLHFNRLKESGQELYPSSIIQSMLDTGKKFQSIEAHNFMDWGTLQDWLHFKDDYATVFIELDGIVVMDSHQHFEPQWGTTEALRRNAIFINKMHETGKVEIILLSSRTVEFEQITVDQLRKNSIHYHRLLMGLPSGSRRILVGGFSEHTSYEAAQAINLRANDDRLDELLFRLM